MMVLPVSRPVTCPVFLMLTIPDLVDVQGFEAAGMSLLESVMLLSTQTAEAPLMVGRAFTVKVMVLVQPSAAVKVMNELPAALASTRPVLSTVATAGFEETHGSAVAGVARLANLLVSLTHALGVPEMLQPPPCAMPLFIPKTSKKRRITAAGFVF